MRGGRATTALLAALMLLAGAGCGERDEPSFARGGAEQPSRGFGEDVDPNAEVALTPATAGALRTVENRLDALDLDQLSAQVERETARVKAKLEALAGSGAGDKVSVADMFELQMQMNRLSQLSEMSTSVVSAANTAISAMARNIKA